MNIINKKYLNRVKEIWDEYILTKKDFRAVSSELRPVIADSWRRSQIFNVSPTSMQDTQIHPDALAQIQKENYSLINIAMPYLEHLYDYMKGTNCLIQVCNKNSCVIKCLSDNDRINDLMVNLSVRQEGYLVSEEKIGTNSTGLCQYLQKPIQVFGEEHFQSRNHNFVCSSAPIFDDDHNIIGILTLMYLKELQHHHTLGMVSIATDGIQKELSIKKAYDNLILTNSILSSTVETIESGIILIDEHKTITLHNQNVLKLLKLPPKSISGIKIFQIIKQNTLPPELQNLNVSVNDTELTVTNYLGKSSDVVLTVETILDEEQNIKATLLSFMTQKYLRKLSSRITGFYAKYTFESILGHSNAIKDVINMGIIASSSDSPVLILGESGTGKELIAQSIHNASSRANEPFISINCGAIPKNLIASELFGAESGAFTGASKNGNPGKFELANGGTLFLDEIGEMPFDLQVALLRILQSKEVTRLGGSLPKKIDVRIISATNKNLIDSINNNTFRLDLYYRLNVLNITLPPLRERTEDIPVLAHYFARQYSNALNKQIRSISGSAMAQLLHYSWPGNVRELENTIERAVNITATDTIQINDLPEEIIAAKNSDLPQQLHNKSDRFVPSYQPYSSPAHDYYPHEDSAQSSMHGTSPEVQEYQMLARLLKQEHGHVKSVAKLSNIPLSTLYAKLKKYNLNPSNYRKW